MAWRWGSPPRGLEELISVEEIVWDTPVSYDRPRGSVEMA